MASVVKKSRRVRAFPAPPLRVSTLDWSAMEGRSDRYRAFMVDWITAREAAAILDVHVSAIPKMIRRGDLSRRPDRRPILDRDEVLAYREARLASQQDRPSARPLKGPPAPPDDHDWIGSEEAAAVMGISRHALMVRARRGQVPSAVASGRRWFRRDHLLLLMNARAANTRIGL